MKTTPHWPVLCSLLVLTACEKPKSEPAPEPPPVEQKAPATPAPEPPKEAAAAPATPEPNYFAPEGVYFLVAKASVETDDGIVGYPPGTRVQQQADGRYQSPDGKLLALAPAQVTNDLRIARHVAGADAAAQAALSQTTRAQVASSNRTAQPTADATPQPKRASTPPPAPSAPSRTGLNATHSVTKRTF